MFWLKFDFIFVQSITDTLARPAPTITVTPFCPFIIFVVGF